MVMTSYMAGTLANWRCRERCQAANSRDSPPTEATEGSSGTNVSIVIQEITEPLHCPN